MDGLYYLSEQGETMAIKEELDFIYEYTMQLALAEGWDERDSIDIARDAVKGYFRNEG